MTAHDPNELQPESPHESKPVFAGDLSSRDVQFDTTRLEHLRGVNQREATLFTDALRLIKNLFLFSAVLMVLIVFAVWCGGASPWLSVLGSMSLIVPTMLLGYLLHHVYKKEHDMDPVKAFTEFIIKNPLGEAVKTITDIISTIKKV